MYVREGSSPFSRSSEENRKHVVEYDSGFRFFVFLQNTKNPIAVAGQSHYAKKSVKNVFTDFAFLLF